MQYFERLMKSVLPVFLLLFALTTGSSPAQTESVDPAAPGSINKPASRELLLSELDRRRPDDTSPFFADRETAEFLNSPAGRRFLEKKDVPTYPNTASYDSVGTVFGGFFKGIFRSIRFGADKPAEMISLSVTPGESFALVDRREITATISIHNPGKKLVAIYFPTSQRFDAIIRDNTGAVVENWATDRAFTPEEAVVMVNPGERLEYSATLSTRELKAGQSYTLEVSLHDNAEYQSSTTLSPY